jgi:formylmethanofuran dehydrogenase subunit E
MDSDGYDSDESDYESANCEMCCENFLLDKLDIIDDKFYCRLCVQDLKLDDDKTNQKQIQK